MPYNIAASKEEKGKMMKASIMRSPLCTDYSDERKFLDYMDAEDEFLEGIRKGVLEGDIYAARVVKGLRNWILAKSPKHKNALQLTCFDEAMQPVSDSQIKTAKGMWDEFPMSNYVYIIKE